MTDPFGTGASAAALGVEPLTGLDAVRHQGLQAMLAGLSHLLTQNEGAREGLRAHAGRVVRLRIESTVWPPALQPAPIDLLIAESGDLTLARSPPPPSVTMILTVSVDMGFAWLRQGAEGLRRHLRIEGDVLLAGALAELVTRLRWDAAEDLSRWTGDVVAERFMSTLRAGAGVLSDGRTRAERLLQRHLTVESSQLVRRDELSAHAEDLAAIESRLLTIERRR